MNTPYEPPDGDVEAALRQSLTEHARRAPAADVLAERIIATVDQPPARDVIRPPRGWRTWGLPLVTAGAVAAVVATVVGVASYRTHADQAPPAATRSAVTSTPVVGPSRTAGVGPAPTPTRADTSTTKVDTSTLQSVHVLDLTFVGTNHGWALASATCIRGSGRCTALIRTTDGSRWHSMPGAQFNVPGVLGCADPCVEHIRFATEQIGYAFGPSALFTTTDGGANWLRESGGADALETLDGNVIRVFEPVVCPGCAWRVATAAVGSRRWHEVTPTPQPRNKPSPNTSSSLSLARSGHRVYLVYYGFATGGGNDATSTLWSSTDDGARWVDRGEPCPQNRFGAVNGEVDTALLTSASDGSVTVLCRPRFKGGNVFVATSTDAGASFRFGDRAALGATPATALAAASSTTILVSSDDTYRSTDGGRRFTRVSGSSPGRVSWVGFASATLGHALSVDGGTVWTTLDAGASWTKASIGEN